MSQTTTSLEDSAFHGPHWTPELCAELERNIDKNGQVGTRIVNETERVRIWLIELHPGERLPFHTHVMDYFWTATTPGRARSRYADGHVAEVSYHVGMTQHYHFGAGQSMTHDLENIGDDVLCFTTVEFLGGENPSLI
jgi:beta-alanine degradation protein BauB